jgi:hypothetical protein
MKRFIVSVLFAAVFFVGLGSLVEKAGAKFKSDEKALGLIAQARQSIGGDQNLAAVKSMSITAKVTKTFDAEGAARTEQGDLEINMQLPDKLSKMLKLGKHDGGDGNAIIEKKMDVVVIADGNGEAKFKVTSDGGAPGDKNVLIRKVEGGNATIEGPDGAKADVVIVRKAGDGGTWTSENGEVHKVIAKGEGHGQGMGAGHGAHHQNEMLRTTLSLLLSAPEGIDVGYTYAGEESVDGTSCDVINVEAAGSSYRLYLDKSSHLPKMISYQAAKPMVMMFRTKSDDAKPAADARAEAHTFTRKIGAPEMAQYQVKFSDYRSVGGVQLPYRWTQTVGGRDDEVVDVTSFDVNPANIASKFQEQKVFVRTKKPDTQQ